MSHEIRTPLQSIIGFAEHLRSENRKENDAVEAIHSSSEHLLHIVNEVLDYSRISSGNFTLARESFSLKRVIREVESAMRIQAEKKGLVLVLDMEQASDVTIVGDAFRLRQILYNLLGNAIKFTTRGFVRLSVTTRSFPDGKIGCLFEIMDTGIGIRKEDIQKIFNQFEQADTSITRNFGGTGLGLTIVKSLVEAQGGKLTVDSEPGRGSTFMVSITYDLSTGKETEQRKERTSEIQASANTGMVLVVDDDPMILRLCGLILKKHKIKHVLFNDPKKLLHETPDPAVTHILMDIRMPGINGVELCQALSGKYGANTRFVALTAHVFEQEKQALYDKGFHRVLSKPFHEDDLVKLLGVEELNSEPVQQLESSEGIDLEPLRKITLYDEHLLHSVVEQFREETMAELAMLDEAVNSGERKVIREIIHKLAGRVGQVGVLSLSLKLRETEVRIEKGMSLTDLEAELRRHHEDVEKLVRQLSGLVLEKS